MEGDGVLDLRFSGCGSGGLARFAYFGGGVRSWGCRGCWGGWRQPSTVTAGRAQSSDSWLTTVARRCFPHTRLTEEEAS